MGVVGRHYSPDDKVIARMKLSAHGVVIMTSHGANERTILPIPYPDGLIIGTRDDPRQFMVKEDSSHIIQMPAQCK